MLTIGYIRRQELTYKAEDVTFKISTTWICDHEQASPSLLGLSFPTCNIKGCIKGTVIPKILCDYLNYVSKYIM